MAVFCCKEGEIMANDPSVGVSFRSREFISEVKKMTDSLKNAEKEFKTTDTQLQTSGTKLDQLKNKYGFLSQQIQQQKELSDKYKEALKQANDEQQKASKRLDEARKKYDEGKVALKGNKEELQKLKDELNKAENAVKSAENAQSKWNSKIADSELAEAKLQKELKDTNDALKDQSGYIKTVNDQFNELQNKTSGIQKATAGTGKVLTASITAPLIAAAGTASKLFMDYEEGQAKVATVAVPAGATNEDLETYREGIIALSNEVNTDVSVLNDALYDGISAIGDIPNALDLVETSAKTAKGGFTDAQTAVNGLTTVLNAYNLTGKESNQIANEMMVAQNRGKTTFGEMAPVIGNVASTAAGLNITTKELFSSLAATTANGILTAQSITGLKAALSNIAKPTDEAKTAAEALNLEISESALKEKGWMQYLTDIRSGLEQASPELIQMSDRISVLNSRQEKLSKNGKKSSDEYKKNAAELKELNSQYELLTEAADGPVSALSKIFGSVEAVNTILALTSKKGIEVFNASMEDMSNGIDYVGQAFDTMSNTRAEKFSASMNRIKNAAIQFGESAAPFIDKVSDAIEGLSKWMSSLTDEDRDRLLKIGIALGTIGPGLSLLSKGITAFNGVRAAISGIGKIVGIGSGAAGNMGTAANKAGGLASALAALPGPAKAAGAALAIAGVGIAAVAVAIKNAEEKFYNLGDAVAEAGEKFNEAVSADAEVDDKIKALDEIKTRLSDSKAPAEELAQAEADRQEIEQWFIDNYGDYITAEEQKNGIRDETLQKIKDLTSAEKERRQSELENQIAMAGIDVPELQKRVDAMEAENEQLQQQKEAALEAQTEFAKLIAEYEKFIQLNPSEDQKQAKLEEITQRAQELADTLSESQKEILGNADGNYVINTLASIDSAILTFGNSLEGFDKKIEANNQKLEDGKQSLADYYSNVYNLLNLDTEGQFGGIAQRIADLITAQEELSQTGQITEDTFSKIADLIPEISSPTDDTTRIAQALNDSISKLSDRIRTSLQNAGSDVNTLIRQIKDIPSYKRTDIIVNISQQGTVQTNAGGTSHAVAGLSVVNEKGPELIESQDGKYRIAQGSPALTYLHSGDRVYTAEETRRMANDIAIPGFATGKSAFQSAKSSFTHHKNTSEVSAAEELAWWQNVLTRFANDAEAVQEAEEQIYKLNRDLEKQSLDDYKELINSKDEQSKNWIRDQKEFNNLSVQDEIAAYERIGSRHKAMTEEMLRTVKMTAEEEKAVREDLYSFIEENEYKIAQLRKELANEELERARELSAQYIDDRFYGGDWGTDDPISAFERVKERELANAAAAGKSLEETEETLAQFGLDMFQNSMSYSEQWLDEQLHYGNITVQEYIEGLDRMKARAKEFYAAGIIDYRTYNEQLRSLDKERFDNYKSLLEQSVTDYYNAQKEILDAEREAVERKYEQEEKAETAADRESELEELYRQESIYSGAATLEGRQKLEDIRDQIAELEKQKRQAEREEEKQAELDAIDEKATALEEEEQTILGNTSRYAREIAGILGQTNQSTSSAFLALISEQVRQQETIAQSAYQTICRIVDQTNQKAKELIGITSPFVSAGGNSGYSNTFNLNQVYNATVYDRTDAELMGRFFAYSSEMAFKNR